MSRWARGLRLLRPSHTHSAFSATIVLMVSTFLSRIIGLVRVQYIVWLFGRGMEADALNAAFVLPDMISYFLVGGAASITFVTILTRYRDTGREAEGERSLSVILTTMYLVLGSAIVLAEIFAPLYIHWWFDGFDAEKAALCVRLTRILLPAQLFFFAGGVFGAVLLVRKQFSVQAVTPLIYGLGTIVGGLLLFLAHRRLGAGHRHGGGSFLRAVPAELALRAARGTRYRWILDSRDEGFREWVRLSIPLMVGVSLVTADGWIIAHFASATSGAVSLMTYAKQLFGAPMSVLAQAAGAASMPFFATLWSQQRRYEFATSVADSVSRVAALGMLAASGMAAMAWPLVELLFVGRRFSPATRGSAPATGRVFRLHVSVVGAGHLFARLLRRGQHAGSHGGGDRGHAGFLAHLRCSLPLARRHGAGGRFRPRHCAADRDHRRAAAPAAHGLHRQPGLSRTGPLPGGGTGRRRSGLGGHLGLGRLPMQMLHSHVPAHIRWTDLSLLVVGCVLWLAIARMDAGKDRLGAAQGGNEAAGAGIPTSIFISFFLSLMPFAHLAQ
jgi:putative peptidoglycan lipid II flippase